MTKKTRNIVLGLALVGALSGLGCNKPVRPIEQVQGIGYWDYNMSKWISPEKPTYKSQRPVYRVHRERDSRLNMGYVEIDRDGDGSYDQIVKFWHRTSPKENPTFWTPSTIELYEKVVLGTDEIPLRIEGFPAYRVSGRLVKKYTAERGISNEQFKKNAQRFFRKNGLDARVLQSESF